MKLQNNSGINSFRYCIYKNEISTNSGHKNILSTTEKIRGSNSSKRKQPYHQILNNLNFHFQIKKQKLNKNNPMKKRFIQKQKLNDKKLSLSKDEKMDNFFYKNINYFEYQKSKKLKLDINYSNSNNFITKKIRGGMKYMNSVGNNMILNNNSENNKIINKFHKIINNKKSSNQKYSSSSLNDNKIKQGSNKLKSNF